MNRYGSVDDQSVNTPKRIQHNLTTGEKNIPENWVEDPKKSTLFYPSWGSWSGWKNFDDSVLSKELGPNRG